MANTWLEMSNGRRLDAIPFVAWFRSAVDGIEHRFDFKVSNPPIYTGDANLFSRLSFETIRAHFADWGYPVDHIIRGESSEFPAVATVMFTGPIAMSRLLSSGPLYLLGRKGKTMAETNEQGLTFEEWYTAAGYSRLTVPKGLQVDWRAGYHPGHYRLTEKEQLAELSAKYERVERAAIDIIKMNQSYLYSRNEMSELIDRLRKALA